MKEIKEDSMKSVGEETTRTVRMRFMYVKEKSKSRVSLRTKPDILWRRICHSFFLWLFLCFFSSWMCPSNLQWVTRLWIYNKTFFFFFFSPSTTVFLRWLFVTITVIVIFNMDILARFSFWWHCFSAFWLLSYHFSRLTIVLFFLFFFVIYCL